MIDGEDAGAPFGVVRRTAVLEFPGRPAIEWIMVINAGERPASYYCRHGLPGERNSVDQGWVSESIQIFFPGEATEQPELPRMHPDTLCTQRVEHKPSDLHTTLLMVGNDSDTDDLDGGESSNYTIRKAVVRCCLKKESRSLFQCPSIRLVRNSRLQARCSSLSLSKS